MPKPKIEIKLIPGEIFEIKPEGKYLIIFNKSDETQGDLAALNQALQSFFGSAKVLAIFASDVSDTKIAELLEDK